MFILLYVLAYIGSANLMRHAEGATWLAIVMVRDMLPLPATYLTSINLLVFYHECRSLIGYATHYLFCDR